jgi:hypothetical protein
MNSEQLELVTAYVDGEATDDERARVEADADLLAEVERQRAARAAVHDVEPPSAAGRDAAIAAALAVFDDEIAPTLRPAHPATIPARDVTAPTNIVPFDQRRRTRWMQSLGAAAALAAVVVAGAVVATRGGGDDDGSTADVRENPPLSVVDTLADDEAAQAPVAAEVATTEGDVLMAVEATAESAPDAGDAAVADQANEYDESTVTTVSGGAAPAAAPPTLGAPPAAPATTAAARAVVIATGDDLLEFAETLKDTPIDVDDAESACSDGSLKADATFEDDIGDQHPIIVVTIDDDTLGAFTLDDCDVVLEADR